MKSKFTFWAYFVVIYTSVFTIFLLFCITADILWNNIVPVYFYIVATTAVLFVWLWMTMGELRKKVIAVEIGFDSFIVRRYLGLGKPATFYFEQLSGYKLSILASKTTDYEYLYLMAGDKKIAKLSAYYHKNYTELKELIMAQKIKYLGFEDYSGAREVKEIFN